MNRRNSHGDEKFHLDTGLRFGQCSYRENVLGSPVRIKTNAS